MKTISIIILTYNNCQETTIPCIESVLKQATTNLVEIIVVDNQSTDETREVIKEYQRENSKLIKVILNNKNYGYAEGNNIGIRQSIGDVVILLNNDTVVTPDWTTTLLCLFEQDDSIGLVGPISNSVGNEQMIACPGMTIDNFLPMAKEYTDQRSGNYFFTLNLGFFCVAVSRNVIDTVGLLDASYGLGMFEDTDYCARVTSAGYKLAVAEDSFVFHSGSFSFNKLSSSHYRNLFEKNLQLFISKNGSEWGISQISIAFWEKSLQDIERLRLYFEGKGDAIPPALEDMIMRSNSQSVLLGLISRLEQEAKDIDYCTVLGK